MEVIRRYRATLVRGGILGVVVLALAACSSGASNSSGSSSASSASSTAASSSSSGNEAPSGEGGGEAPSVRFVSSRYHYQVDAPGTMTEASDGTATASYGVEHLSIRVVTGSSAQDPNAYARNDAATVQSQTRDYRTVNALGTVSMNGRAVSKLVYSWTGTSPVTGKDESLISVRYYVAKDSTTLAVLNYTILATAYDPQGADDVASTFRWQ